MQEVYYREYFEELARKNPNFTYRLALSEPQPEDNWNSLTGLIHEVLLNEYLKNHPNPGAVEYYLCGPPLLIKAARTMLQELGVAPGQISFDEF